MSHANWPLVPLGELMKQSSDKVRVEPGVTYPNFGIYGFGRGLFEKPPIDGAMSSATVLYRASADQFVYSRLFAFEGAYGLVDPALDGHFVSNEFPLFDVDKQRLLPKFIAWYFRCREIWSKIAELTTGMGSRRQRIKPDALLKCSFPLPPIAEQQRIVDRIEYVASRLEEANQLRGEINDRTLSMLRSRFARIVEDAPLRPMQEVAPLVRRKAEIAENGSYPELGVRSFGKGTFHKPALDFTAVGTKKLYRIESGDLVFSNVFAWEGAIAVAQPIDHGRFGSHRFITCVPTDEIDKDFLCFYFRTENGMSKVRAASPGGAGRNRTLGLKKLESIEVPVPDIADQRLFASVLAKVVLLQNTRAAVLNELHALLPSVLDRAFSGKL